MNILELKHSEYIRVNYQGKQSFGGSQTWFPLVRPLSRDYNLHKWGCGTVGVSDLFLYIARCHRKWNTPATALASSKKIVDSEAYMTYIRYMHNHFAWVIPGSGIVGLALADSVRHYAWKYKIPIHARWRALLSDEKMLSLLREMIENDLPAIIAVGPNMPNAFGKHGVAFYARSRTLDNTKLEHYKVVYKTVKSHYVTVTGIVTLEDGKHMLQISSWGNRYYIDYDEYRSYIKKHGDRVTSSMLYVKWKKNKEK